ncbi:TetR/AcrR family transcriptional regulator [Marinactinospora rubrisoli]|uniref:TetR/AcrR family transcriptional regulator n=1 Tax=Marinactinospora rubrisoli TaxID=2715399 RepID=A0ABW2KCX0_9ACTN
MPRTADHELRRRQIADAVCSLVATQGLDSVTVARTAATAGMSVGLVQHYFRSKDDMLLCAFQTVSADIRARVGAHVATGERHRRTIAAILLDALTEYVPLDDERRAEHRVARALAGRALDVPRLAEVDAATAAGLRAEIARAVRNGKECGEVAGGVVPESAALRLFALADGLAAQVYRAPGDGFGHRDTAEAVATALRAELATVFTGECRRYRTP